MLQTGKINLFAQGRLHSIKIITKTKEIITTKSEGDFLWLVREEWWRYHQADRKDFGAVGYVKVSVCMCRCNHFSTHVFHNKRPTITKIQLIVFLFFKRTFAKCFSSNLRYIKLRDYSFGILFNLFKKKIKSSSTLWWLKLTATGLLSNF